MNPQKPHTPRLARWLMERAVHHADKREVMGDMAETYNQLYRAYDRNTARRWYWSQVIRSIPTFLILSFYWSFVMLKNYLKVAVRNLRTHRAYSSINILGLSIGLACSFFILLWVQDEMSYDRFHEEGDQIYRVMRHSHLGGNIYTTSSIPKPLDDVLDEEYPEITHSVLMDWEWPAVLTLDDQVSRVKARHFGPDLFNVFSFPLILGDPAAVLDNPESIAISESIATRYFGGNWRSRNDILGTVFSFENRLDVTLTGVFEDVPDNSSIEFEVVLPVEELMRRNPQYEEAWDNNALSLFVRLEEDVDYQQVSAKISGLIDEHVDRWHSEVFLHPLTDWHLRSDFEDGVLVGGRIDYVRIFLLVALFVILIASINFMNLATARSTQRSKEIGVRKSVGATQSLLARQFLGESVFTALIAFGVAMILVGLLLPSFNTLTGKNVSMGITDYALWLQFGGVALITGFLAGSYPALYLSSFNVIGVLRSRMGQVSRGAGLRKSLVVFQFIMSIVLIVSTFTVYRQLQYIRSKDLGIDRENVLFFNLDGNLSQQLDSFKQDLLREPGIINAASSSTNPLAIRNDTNNLTWDGKDPDDNSTYWIISAGHDFIETMDIDVAEGRRFSRAFGDDTSNFMLNQKAVESMGLIDPVGQIINVWGREGTIVGIVTDFHGRSLYSPILPVIIRLVPQATRMMFVRIQGGDPSETLAGVERIYRKFNPEYPFNYRFMDEAFESSYRSEIVIGNLANIFALVAIMIACLGLFGLAAFTAEQRTKEIGIRKALGASISSVVVLLSRDFLLLVGGAFVVAAPIAFFVMNDWLNGFEFHTNLGVGVLGLAGVASIMIAGLTVSWQSIRAATANPIQSLRSE